MKNAAGIVSTHAQTICPATPQRTADKRRTGADADNRAGDRVCRAHRHAGLRRDENRDGRACLRRKPAHRLQLGDLRSQSVPSRAPIQPASRDRGTHRDWRSSAVIQADERGDGAPKILLLQVEHKVDIGCETHKTVRHDRETTRYRTLAVFSALTMASTLRVCTDLFYGSEAWGGEHQPVLTSP